MQLGPLLQSSSSSEHTASIKSSDYDVSMSHDIASELPMSQDVSSDPHEVQNTVEGTSSPVKNRARFPSFEQIKMCDTGT